jgi:hypothetical protein
MRLWRLPSNSCIVRSVFSSAWGLFDMSDNLDGYVDFVQFVPDTILVEMGRTTAAFGFMEDALNELIGTLLGAGPKTTQAVTFKIRNITDRMALARKLVELRIPTFNEKILDAIGLAEKANERRNVIIHHALTEIRWNEDPAVHQVSFQKKDHYSRKTPVQTMMSGADFKSLSGEVRTAAIKVGAATKMCALILKQSGPSP